MDPVAKLLAASPSLPAAAEKSSAERAGARIKTVAASQVVGKNSAVALPQDAAQAIDRQLADDVAKMQAAESPASGTSRSPTKQIGDEAFIRRLSLDLLGKTPSAAEVTAFTLDPAADKRQKTIDRYLASAAFGDNWAHYWRDVILYRRTDERALFVAAPLKDYLTEQFNKNTPWDEIARAFITAKGDVRETGALGVIISQFGETNDIAAEISRIFIGVQIQCAQCHDHKTDRWKREQFHELAAFFPRISVRQTMKDDKRSIEVGSVDRELPFARKANGPRGSTEHYMPDLSRPQDKGKLMQPVFFVTGQTLSPGKTDKERRETIAQWITSEQDPWFAKAFVNRIWAEMIGEGFYEPVDDIGPDRECTAADTLEYLSSQFVAHNYDVKWLFATITATHEYQQESRSRRKPNEKPFLANCTQRLRGDQLYTTLISTLGLPDQATPTYGSPSALLSRSPRGQFNAVFGYDPSTRRDEVAGSIPQALLLMNGRDLNRAIDGRTSFTSLGKLLASTKDDEAVVVELYLRCLAREPQSSEIKTSLDYVKKVGNRSDAFEDLLWALINSTEFLHRK